MNENDNISKFPVSTWQRILNRRGKRTVNCIVSGRYLRYDDLGPSSIGYFPARLKIGTPVTIDVMTDSDTEKEPRKICELTLTLEELKDMVSRLEKDIADHG
jgi:hypothetical protein